MKKLYLILTVLMLSISFVACHPDDSQSNFETAYEIPVEDILTDQIDFSKWEDFDYTEYSYTLINDTTDNYHITEAGIYLLSGFLTETITVTVLDTDDVYLVLDNVNINTGVNQAIYVESAEDVIINVLEGTNNYFIDSNNYDQFNENLNAVVYSDTDLVINGTGSLTVTSNYNDAIQSKDDLTIVETHLAVISFDDGLIGKDSVRIGEATVSLSVSGDGIKTTNTENQEDGFMYFDGCTLSIDAKGDGIQATNYIIFISGTFTIETLDKGVMSDTSIYIYDGEFYIDTVDESFVAEEILEVYGGNI